MKQRSHKINKNIILLQIIFLLYSFGGYFAKTAAMQEFLSVKFIVSYMIFFLILGLYAIFWQQIIKTVPLTTAYANKVVTVIWGVVWGAVFFGEKITVGKLIGTVFIVAGIVVYAMADDS